MVKPGVGRPSSEYRAVCVYSPLPDGEHCGAEAANHVLVESPQWGVVALAACTAHVRIARQAGRHVDEHEYAGYCGLPGTVWAYPPVSACVLDDTGQEPELVGVGQIEGAGTVIATRAGDARKLVRRGRMGGGRPGAPTPDRPNPALNFPLPEGAPV